MSIKVMTLHINDITPQQYYLSTSKYKSIVEFMSNDNDYGAIAVIKYKDKYFSIDGHHRLFYLYKQGVTDIKVQYDKEDDSNYLYQQLADEAMDLGIHTIADLKDRFIDDHDLYIRNWIDKCQVMLLTEQEIKDYKENPCSICALPLYKEIRIDNSSIQVLHENTLTKAQRQNNEFTRYFRLQHNLQHISLVHIEGYAVRTVDISKDIEDIKHIINSSYQHLSIDEKKINYMLTDRVYNKDLWIMVYDIKTQKNIALGICHYDDTVNEVDFDWIQVLPHYRGLGLGKMLVTNLLDKASKIAQFATVSGEVDNPSSPELLYRSTGFKGNDVWYVKK